MMIPGCRERHNLGGEHTNITGKYILKSIATKKLRTALIILSIAVSAALYFASASISDTMVRVQTKRWRANVGYTDLMVKAWWESPSRYFNPDRISGLEEYFEYAVGTVSGYGQYRYGKEKDQGFQLWGIDYDDLNRITTVGMKEVTEVYPFTGKKMIISFGTADKFGLRAGDMVTLTINGSRQKFLICGIAYREGPFLGEGESVTGVVPPDTIRSLYNIRGKVDTLYVKLKNSANKQQMMEILGHKFPKYHVSEPFTEQEIRSQNNRIRMPFLALSIILSFMSIYIISSTFRVITFERLPDIGTYLSIGARKRTINRILLTESLIYGGAGGAAGCLLGIVALYLMSIFTMPSWDGGYKASISFHPKQLLFTFLMALLLCLVSSVRPIMSVHRIAVKDIILNMVENAKTNKKLRALTGFVLLIICSLAPLLVRGKNSMYLNALCIVGVLAASVLIVPFLVHSLIWLLERVYGALFGNIGGIAVRNLRDNKSINGSVALLAIGISCVLFVNTLSYSTLQELVNYYDRNRYEIYMSAKDIDREYLQEIRTTPGIKDVTKVMGIGGLELADQKDIIGLTVGVDTEEYLDYNNLQISGDREALFGLLEQGRAILLTNRMKNRLGIKTGDVIRLRAWGKISSYTVAGFFDSIESGGSFAIVSEKYMRLDMGWKDSFYSTILIKTEGDPGKVLENLNDRFVRQQPFLRTMQQMKYDNIRYNEQLFLIAKGFSVITMLAGILGIFNNLIINFIRRKRLLAMFRSVGMSKPQIIQMIYVEALSLGIAGSIAGTTAGLLMLISGTGLLKALEMEVNIHYSSVQIGLCLVLGIAISILASVWPALKSSKLNLMEAVKYE